MTTAELSVSESQAREFWRGMSQADCFGPDRTSYADSKVTVLYLEVDEWQLLPGPAIQ